jgi:hypothetical protein
MQIGRIYFTFALISDGKTEEKNGGRKNQIDCLELPAPFEPFPIADA